VLRTEVWDRLLLGLDWVLVMVVERYLDDWYGVAFSSPAYQWKIRRDETRRDWEEQGESAKKKLRLCTPYPDRQSVSKV
jgi:hypothetical protein